MHELLVLFLCGLTLNKQKPVTCPAHQHGLKYLKGWFCSAGRFQWEKIIIIILPLLQCQLTAGFNIINSTFA